MILFYFITALIALCYAQLDLPPVNELQTSSERPNSYVTSQSFGNHQDVNLGDDDRSTRSGPPYSSLEDDEPQNREGRILSTRGNFNGSANSPYTDRNSFYDRNSDYNNYNNDLDRSRYNLDERNRYYIDERERERNYNRFTDDRNKFNDRTPFNDGSRNRNPYDNNNYNSNDNRNRYDDPNLNPYNNPTRNPYDNRNNPYDNMNQYNERNRNPYDNQNRNSYDNQNRNPYDNANNRNPYNNGDVFVDERDRNLNRDNVFVDERNRHEQDYRYQQEMEKLRNFLSEIDHKGSQECTENVAAQWEFETNVNDHTSTKAVSTNCNCFKIILTLAWNL